LVYQNAVIEKRVHFRFAVFQRIIPEYRLIIRGDRQRNLISVLGVIGASEQTSHGFSTSEWQLVGTEFSEVLVCVQFIKALKP